MSEDIPQGTRFVHSEQPFEFHLGGQLPDVRLAYETWGELSAERDNAVMILTGLSPNAHAASNADNPSEGWWEPMIGPGKPIDTDRHFVICINSLGSCKGSTGAASANPETGNPWRLEFPDLTVQDIARAANLVVHHLGIEQLRALVGPSLGGMSCLAWLQQNPDGARHFLSIATAAAAEPFGIAIRSIQRECVVSDRAWQDGQYSDEEWPETGMRLARKLGMTSYRSPEEWVERFGRLSQIRYEHKLFSMDFAIESYLEAAANKFIRTFDPCCYLYLSRAIDLFDAAEDFDDLEEALAPIALESKLVIGVETDILWPLRQQEALAEAFAANGVKTEFRKLRSIQGHDSFLVDYNRFRPAVAKYFRAID